MTEGDAENQKASLYINNDADVAQLLYEHI